MANVEAQPGPEEGVAGPTSLREQARAEIHRQLQLQGAHEHSRSALAVMAESYLRFLRSEQPHGYRIVDDKEKPRPRDVQRGPFTIADLVAELRNKHPALFSGPAQGSVDAEPAGGSVDQAPADAVQPLAPAVAPPEPTSAVTPPPRLEPPARDWLRLGPGPAEVSPLDRAGGTAVTRPARADRGAPNLSARFETVTRARVAIGQAVKAWRTPFKEGYARVRPRMAAATAALKRRGGSVLGLSAQFARRFQPLHALVLGAFLVGVLGVVLASALFSSSTLPDADSRTETAAVPRADPARTASEPPSALAQMRELRGIPEVIDTASLLVEGKLVRLFGVEWDRGGVRDELAGYLKGRPVVCKPAAVGDRYRCLVESRDLSEVVLYNGGGRATIDAPPELRAAENHARAEKLGVWNK